MFSYEVTFILFFLIVVDASDFKLCCQFGYQYVPDSGTCSPMLNRSLTDNLKILPIFNSNTLVRSVNVSAYNIVKDPWCRNTNGRREIYAIDDEYFIQNNGDIYIPNEEDKPFSKDAYCLGLLQGRQSYVPVMCAVGEGQNPSYHNTIGKLLKYFKIWIIADWIIVLNCSLFFCYLF